jgi:dephospho-CoA kinase
MLLVAVTGGIGSGKSTVSAGLAARGAAVVDADGVARQIVEPGGPAYQPVVDRFGSGVLHEDGTLDRAALARMVFDDPEALAALNSITHPVIGAVISERLAAHTADDVVVLDIPLLNAVTIQLYRPAAVIVVDTPEEVAVSRLVAHRGFTEPDARSRVAAQVSRHERRGLLDLAPAGLLVDNAGDRRALDEAVDRAWAWIQALPARR